MPELGNGEIMILGSPLASYRWIEQVDAPASSSSRRRSVSSLPVVFCACRGCELASPISTMKRSASGRQVALSPASYAANTSSA